jgi:hypothetical protein
VQPPLVIDRQLPFSPVPKLPKPKGKQSAGTGAMIDDSIDDLWHEETGNG